MLLQKRKIGIIGAGHVGAHVAFLLAAEGLADELVLYDIDRKKLGAQVMDIRDAVSYFRTRSEVYEGTIGDMKNADVLIQAAGNIRIPGQNRLDKLEGSIKLCKDIIPQIEKSGFEGFIISITNPCDIIAAYIQKKLDWTKEKIIGSGTALDSARLQEYLSSQLQVAQHSLTAYLLGEHGDSSMIPWSHVYVAGKPIKELLAENPGKYHMEHADAVLEKIHQRASLEVKGKGSTEFGIAASVCELVRTVLHNEQKVIPCSVYLEDIYGVKQGFASVPVKLGIAGIEDIIEFQMTTEEQKQFQSSIAILQKHFSRALLL